MRTHTLKLPNRFVDFLISLPETGMGYQTVRILLKDGTILPHHTVLNASLLVLKENEDFTAKEISRIELEQNSQH